MASALEKRPGEEVPVTQFLGAGGAFCAIVRYGLLVRRLGDEAHIESIQGHLPGQFGD